MKAKRYKTLTLREVSYYRGPGNPKYEVVDGAGHLVRQFFQFKAAKRFTVANAEDAYTHSTGFEPKYQKKRIN